MNISVTRHNTKQQYMHTNGEPDTVVINYIKLERAKSVSINKLYNNKEVTTKE